MANPFCLSLSRVCSYMDDSSVNNNGGGGNSGATITLYSYCNKRGLWCRGGESDCYRNSERDKMAMGWRNTFKNLHERDL